MSSVKKKWAIVEVGCDIDYLRDLETPANLDHKKKFSCSVCNYKDYTIKQFYARGARG